jgi:DNA-binding CsgD family transcriptional regulator
VTISERLTLELLRRRASGERQYQIAKAARLHPSTVSALVNDALPIAANDRRVLRLAEVLGLTPADCFQSERMT